MPRPVPETTRWHCQITRTLSVWSELLLHIQSLFLSHSLCGLFITLGIGCGVCVGMLGACTVIHSWVSPGGHLWTGAHSLVAIKVPRA